MLLPSTSQQNPFGITAMVNPENSQVQVIAARYTNGARPQVTLGGNFDVDQIGQIHRELLERADLPQSSPYFPVLQSLQKLQAITQGPSQQTGGRQYAQQDWRQGQVSA